MTRGAPLILFLLVVACAQVREPEGGPRDTVPPVLVGSDPPNGSLHFKSDRIVLRFDERVKLDRARERLLISPPLERLPDVTVSGTEVTIRLREMLWPNTTYTFNIGEAVADVTENNPAEGVAYVCSTGNVLDSLKITGVVLDALTGDPLGSVSVLLHADTDSLGFTTGRPFYFTRTDKSGNFKLQHLRGGRYRLHALRDQNANYRYDLPNEEIAFSDELVSTSDTATHTLRLFRESAPTQQILDVVVQPERDWRVVFARRAMQVELRALDRTGGTLVWYPEWNASRDTALLWPSDTTLLQGQRFEVTDSSAVIDTLTYRLRGKMPFNVMVRGAGVVDAVPVFIASRPIALIDQEKVMIRRDTGTAIVGKASDPLLNSDTLRSRDLHLARSLGGEGNWMLELLPGAVRDIYDGTNDTLRIALGSGNIQDAGSLRVDLQADTAGEVRGPFVLQLLNAQGGVVFSEVFGSLPHRLERPAIVAATYSLKLIADVNGDGLWSPGSLKVGRQPERVYRHVGEVNVRAGWEVALDWVVR